MYVIYVMNIVVYALIKYRAMVILVCHLINITAERTHNEFVFTTTQNLNYDGCVGSLLVNIYRGALFYGKLQSIR